MEKFEELLRAQQPPALASWGMDWEADDGNAYEACVFVLDKYLLEGLPSGKPVLKAKPLRIKWGKVRTTESDQGARGSASCFLDRAEGFLRDSFYATILGKLFVTGSYVVFLRPDDLTALVVREHYALQQTPPQPAPAGGTAAAAGGEQDSQGSAGIGISLMVSSAGWHHWAGKGDAPRQLRLSGSNAVACLMVPASARHHQADSDASRALRVVLACACAHWLGQLLLHPVVLPHKERRQIVRPQEDDVAACQE